MKALLKVVLVVSIVYLSGVAGRFLAGVIAAIAAAYFHASPQATVFIVRVLATIFFIGFVLLAWVIYSRQRTS
jgi:hypothetical protein